MAGVALPARPSSLFLYFAYPSSPCLAFKSNDFAVVSNCIVSGVIDPDAGPVSDATVQITKRYKRMDTAIVVWGPPHHAPLFPSF